MCFKKKIILQFVLILFFLIPGICADSLLTNDTSFMSYNNDRCSFLSLNTADSKVLSAADNSENIDNIVYKSFSLCMTDTFVFSESFQINQLINRFQSQSKGFKFSIFIIPVFMLLGYSLLSSEYLYIIIKFIKEQVIIYIHKSDGKKKIYTFSKFFTLLKISKKFLYYKIQC